MHDVRAPGAVLVQKYGGSSVATPDKICAVADRICRCLEENPALVVVVSAMGKTTDQLVAMAGKVAKHPHGREMDLLLASGEQIAVSLLGLALQDHGAFVVIIDRRATAWCERLAERGVVADARGEYLRLCPDILTTDVELERAAHALRAVAR